MTASPNPSTTKLLDVFIEKQAQIKNLEAIVAELRKQIQDRNRAGELDSLDDAGRYQYKNLTIQTSHAKAGSIQPPSTNSKKKNSSMETQLKPSTPRIDSSSRTQTPEPVLRVP